MSDDDDKEHKLGARLLSFDGCHSDEMGPLAQLLIIKEIINRLEHDTGKTGLRPCDLFEMMCGSGTGGLIAVMLGKLKMTVDEAIEAYLKLFPVVYSNQKGKQKEQSEKEKSAQLSERLEAMIRASNKTEDGESAEPYLYHEGAKCKVFVCTWDSRNLASPVLFRSYRVRSNASYNCTVREAALATMAVPGEYAPVLIGDKIKQSYIAASHGYNNPAGLLLQEANGAFPDRAVSVILSMGTGHPGVTEMESSEEFIQVVFRLALDCEKVSQDVVRRFSHIPGLIYRLSVDQGMQRRLLKGSEATGEIAALVRSYLATTKVDKSMNQLVDSMVQRKRMVHAKDLGGSVRQISRLPKICPSPSANFTGRREELSQIHDYFASGTGRHIFVLHGLGGSGKTQVCLKFIADSQLREQPRFSEVFFVDASSVETIENEMEAIAQEKKIGDSTSDVLDALARRDDEWLIVFDNADNPSIDLSQFVPSGLFGNVLITSRNPGLTVFSKQYASIELGNLAEEDAITLLLATAKYAPSDKVWTLARAVVEELHCFALAITQAGAYIANSCSLSDYLQIYRIQRDEMLEDRHGQDPDMYNESVYTTWSLSVRKLSPVAYQLLHFCSFIHYQGIRKEIFERAAHTSSGYHVDSEAAKIYTVGWLDHSATGFLRMLGDDKRSWNLAKFLRVAKEVQSYSLLHYDRDNDYYAIHPLVHAWGRTLPVKSSRSKPAQSMAVVLALSISLEERQEDYTFRLSLIPHLDAIRQHAKELDHEDIALRYQRAYRDAGRWTETEQLMRSALESVKRLWGEEHPHTLSAMANLASVFRNQGRWTEAEPFEVSVLNARKKLFGLRHPDTLYAMANLAATIFALGRWKEAATLEETVLEGMKQLHGEEHRDTLTSMGNFATTLSSRGQLKEAEQMEVTVLDGRRRLLGEEHPDTLRAMANLASTFRDQGRWKEAEQMEVKVLEARRRLLGEEHPDTLTSMSGLARTLTDQGRWKEATELNTSVLETRRRLLGEKHPDTRLAMENLIELQELRTEEFVSHNNSPRAKRKRSEDRDDPETLVALRPPKRP